MHSIKIKNDLFDWVLKILNFIFRYDKKISSISLWALSGIWIKNRRKSCVFDKMQKLKYQGPKSTIWYWGWKIYTLKVFLRSNPFLKQFWSKIDFSIFWKFWGYESNPGVTNKWGLWGHESHLGVTNKRKLGVTNGGHEKKKKSMPKTCVKKNFRLRRISLI